MRILSWNIRHGGKARVDRIVAALEQHRPDCIVLMEFRAGPGEIIRRRLEQGGWVYQVATVSKGNANGLLLAARTDFVPVSVVSGPDLTRFIPVSFPGSKFHLWAAHVPSWNNVQPADVQPKTRFWDALLRIASTNTQPTLLVGDFHTGRHRIDEPAKTFKLADRFEQLSQKWIDAWRHFHGDQREFSRIKPALVRCGSLYCIVALDPCPGPAVFTA
jgi:exonuclease III